MKPEVFTKDWLMLELKSVVAQQLEETKGSGELSSALFPLDFDGELSRTQEQSNVGATNGRNFQAVKIVFFVARKDYNKVAAEYN